LYKNYIQGIHAREWIAPAMATYLMNELLEGKGRHFLDQFNFYILPSANPDGYEYSRTNNRLWRKSRSPGISQYCMGVDINRNFESFFNGKCTLLSTK
jgi:murein tripeptide amidase MpaA